MIDKILKIAKCKDGASFYAKFPTEKAFMAKYGKEFKKAQMGNAIQKAQNGPVDPLINNTPMVAKTAGLAVSNNPLSNELLPMKTLGGLGSAMPYVQGALGVIKGLDALKGEKQKLKVAKQSHQVSDVQALASRSRDVDANRMNRQLNPQLEIQNAENQYGVGTNVLSRNGSKLEYGGPVQGEIQNTYGTGNSIYDDGGFEPLSDSDIVKQYRAGGFIPINQAGGRNLFGGQGLMGGNTNWMANTELGKFVDEGGGEMINSSHIATGGDENAGGDIGGAIGGTVGTAFFGPVGGAIGKFAGDKLGRMFDKNPEKTKRENEATNRNMDISMLGHNSQVFQQQNSGSMRDGGWMNPEYNPQVISHFGEHRLKDLLAPDKTMDTLRAGGHLQEYSPPSERAMQTYEDGGDISNTALNGAVRTTWGGGVKTLSQNPYMPSDTIQFVGNSHDTSDNNGHTGIGVEYGGSNQSPTQQYAEYGTENANANVEVEKEPATETVDPNTGRKNLMVYGNLVLNAEQAKQLGDTHLTTLAESYGGKKIKNIQTSISKDTNKVNKQIESSTKALAEFTPTTPIEMFEFNRHKAIINGGNQKLKNYAEQTTALGNYQQALNDTAAEHRIEADAFAKGNVKIDKKAEKEYARFGGKFTQAKKGEEVPKRATSFDGPALARKQAMETMSHLGPKHTSSDFNFMAPTASRPDIDEKTPKSGKENWSDYAMMAGRELIPYMRPSDAEQLDPRQLYGEMNALASNQEEGVQMQSYQPQMAASHDIYLGDQLANVHAAFAPAKRAAASNPALLAQIAAQEQESTNKILGEQFRMNQAEKANVYGKNVDELNRAKQINMGEFDKQFMRQAEGRANTKAVKQLALNSMADKFAKNKLENRQLKTYENLYNYRQNDNGQFVNMNAPAQFNTQVGAYNPTGLTKAETDAAEAKAYKDAEAKKIKDAAKKIHVRNGSIVRALNNL